MGDRKTRAKKSNSEMSSSSSSSTSSFDSEEETDARDLKPIRGYLSNRRELARQLFKSVKSDKIRMMLPQILKNMNLSDLEEWCASELCGMSEARILCILNGQTMLNSSDTSETDDSGPSLEIISDTEEWLTDTDIAIKEEPSSSGISKTKRSKPTKSKIKPHGQIKRNDQDKLRARARAKGNTVVPFEPDVRIKKEKEKDNRAGTNKEGESLLDLLELEMRARAIRALIRKEEDVIPSEATEKRMAMTANALRNTLNSAVSASLTDEKSLNGKFNLDVVTENNDNENSVEKSTRKSTELGEDEDVVFVVVKPTPTIELLSSESGESDNDKKRAKNEKKTDEVISQVSAKIANQRSSKNETIPEITLSRDATTSERIVTIDKSNDGSDSLKIVITKRISESSNSTSPGKSSKTRKITVERADKSCAKIVASENEKNSEKILEPGELPSSRGLFKKIRRKQNLRTKRKNVEDCSVPTTDQSDETLKNSPIPVIEPGELPSDAKKDDQVSTEIPIEATIKLEIPENAETRVDASTTRREEEKFDRREPSRPKRVSIDDDRLDDFEEIIDLDDYPDDMEEMDNNEVVKKITTNDENIVIAQSRIERKTPQIINDTIITTRENLESSETWASRYYQTDDVQNVIKESKIQSEIRKRLRERQRLSKLNSSPKLNSPGDGTLSLEKTEEKIEQPKPTGSVQEYLALKNSISSSSNDGVENNDTGETKSDEKSIDNNPGKSPEKNLEKSPEKSPEKSLEKSPEKSLEKSSDVEKNDKNSTSAMELVLSTDNISDETSVALSILTESAAKVQ